MRSCTDRIASVVDNLLTCLENVPALRQLHHGPTPPRSRADFLATVFEVARTGICIVDETGMFVRVNPAFCQLVDYSLAELVGRHYAMCAPPSVAEVKDKFLDALLGDSPKIRANGRSGGARGAVRWAGELGPSRARRTALRRHHLSPTSPTASAPRPRSRR
jgi:PAS domain S-box-containing protein